MGEMVVIPGAGHGFYDADDRLAMRKVVAFVEREDLKKINEEREQ